jgi:hypothetical protein
MGVSKSKDAKIIEQALQAQFSQPGFPNPANGFQQQQPQQPVFQPQQMVTGQQMPQPQMQMQMPTQQQLQQQLHQQLQQQIQQQQPQMQMPSQQQQQVPQPMSQQGFVQQQQQQPAGFSSFPPFPAMPQPGMGNMQFPNLPSLPANAIFPSNTSSAFPINFGNQRKFFFFENHFKFSSDKLTFSLNTELKALIPGYAPAPDRRNMQMLHQQPLQQQPHEMQEQEFSTRGFFVEQQMMPQMQGMQSIKSRKPQQH